MSWLIYSSVQGQLLGDHSSSRIRALLLKVLRAMQYYGPKISGIYLTPVEPPWTPSSHCYPRYANECRSRSATEAMGRCYFLWTFPSGWRCRGGGQKGRRKGEGERGKGERGRGKGREKRGREKGKKGREKGKKGGRRGIAGERQLPVTPPPTSNSGTPTFFHSTF